MDAIAAEWVIELWDVLWEFVYIVIGGWWPVAAAVLVGLWCIRALRGAMG